MNRKMLIPIMLLLAVVALGYAIYRSTGERITTTENGKQIVYGEPQHGLVFGLCVFAGLCVIGIAILAVERYQEIRQDQRTVTTRTDTASNYPK